MDIHDISDFTRDTLSAIAAGLFIVAVGGIVTMFRVNRARLGRHGIEIRNLNTKAEIKPIFPEYPADKL